MFKEDLMQGQTMVITGGGTGLGKSMARRLSELGASIAITSRKMDTLEKTATEISSATGHPVFPVACDVRKPAMVETMTNAVVKEFGQIDGLINNAAGNFISPTENLTPGGFKVIVDIVLNGTFNTTQSIGAVMRKQNRGSILNIITTYAWTGSGYVVPSAAAKAGVLALTRSLAVEWAKYGIRSNAIAPGPFPTEGAWKRLVPPGLGIERAMKNRIPLKRFGEHHELANLVVYLMSEEAGYINGEVITIDGGEWLKGAGQFNGLDIIPKVAWKGLRALRKGK
ncbi:MAG: SDR family oxidoreductase [Fidelibacterota bacterium]